MKEPIRCYIRILSPTHVGCDEVYEPTSFTIDEQNCRLTVFDPMDLMRHLEKREKERFSVICRKGTVSSILEIYQFLRGRKIPGREVAACQGLVEHYDRTLSLSQGDKRGIQENLARFAISRTAFTPDTGRPFLPGSAIKGSIRTAYLNARARVKSIRPMRGKSAAQDLEEALLDGGRFETDPFRMLKVSDFMPVGDVKTRVVYAVNEKKAPSTYAAKGPYQILEVIEPGSTFYGWISIEEPEREAKIRSPLKREEVFRSLDDFFRKQKAKENAELRQIGITPFPIGDLDGGHLLRVGRHSGAESVTIEGHRSIKILGRRVPSESATTFWLAAQEPRPKQKEHLRPFGWILLGKTTPEMEEDFSRRETLWQRNHEKALEERLAFEAGRREELAEQKRIAEEEAKQQALEAIRRHEEDERRQKEIAKMSPEERAAATIGSSQVTEQEVVEIYRRIDDFSDKVTVAQALKEYWISVGKWERKACSKKQWGKVQKIRGILGEAES